MSAISFITGKLIRIAMDKENLKGKLVSLPTREDITVPIREQLIVELYSK